MLFNVTANTPHSTAAASPSLAHSITSITFQITSPVTWLPIWNRLGCFKRGDSKYITCPGNSCIEGIHTNASIINLYLLISIPYIADAHVRTAATTSALPLTFKSSFKNCLSNMSKTKYSDILKDTASISHQINHWALCKHHALFRYCERPGTMISHQLPSRVTTGQRFFIKLRVSCSSHTERLRPGPSDLTTKVHAYLIHESTLVITLSTTEASSGFPRAPGHPAYPTLLLSAQKIPFKYTLCSHTFICCACYTFWT